MHYKKSAAIAVALTAAFIAGMAATSLTRASAPRFTELTVEQLNDQQRPIADRSLKFSSIGIGRPYHIWLRSPRAGEAITNLVGYVRLQSSLPVRLREFSIMIQGRMWRS